MNPEQYENLISLLEQALLFYGDKSNYLVKSKSPDSNVRMDNGLQARFALEKIKELKESMNKLESDYIGIVNDINESENTPENIINIIEKIKNND